VVGGFRFSCGMCKLFKPPGPKDAPAATAGLPSVPAVSCTATQVSSGPSQVYYPITPSRPKSRTVTMRATMQLGYMLGGAARACH
jgi:hypothetical protein